MFMGDSLQFSSIIDIPLYSTNIHPIFMFTKSTKKKVIYKSLCKNYIKPNNVILRKKMRCNRNIQYAIVLENLQTWNIPNLNFNLLKTPFLSNLDINLFDDPCNTITYIILRNELWNYINHYIIDIHSKTSRQKCLHYYHNWHL
jgi:hypothetical protein